MARGVSSPTFAVQHGRYTHPLPSPSAPLTDGICFFHRAVRFVPASRQDLRPVKPAVPARPAAVGAMGRHGPP